MTRRQDEIGQIVLGQCFECDTPTSGLHHVVPWSVGGRRQLPLCTECHTKAHAAAISLPALIRKGLDRARKRGVTLGAPTKWTPALVLRARGLRARGWSYAKIAKSLEFSVGSVHRKLKIR